jgi:hypothetical protein
MAHGEAEASTKAVKEGLQLCILSVVHCPSSARGAPKAPVVALSSSGLAGDAALLEEERQPLLDEHHSATERLRDQEETLISYSDTMSELRESLKMSSGREAALREELKSLQSQLEET